MVRYLDHRWGSYTLSDSRVPLRNLNLFWKKSYKNPSWEPEQVAGNIPIKVVQSNNCPRPRDENEYAPSSRTLGMSQLFISTDGKSNMPCTRYLQGGKHSCNSWSTEPQQEALLEDEQKFKLGGCWWPQIHILAVNFSGITQALHYVPFIFCLFLTSSTSFGWVLIGGAGVPKMSRNGQNPRLGGLS